MGCELYLRAMQIFFTVNRNMREAIDLSLSLLTLPLKKGEFSKSFAFGCGFCLHKHNSCV
ncbi:hypothetical protein KSB_34060 [Ktedonobacter robiniae]|uniref:Uncharacterized protein n=1 Tax=Ktedonobacter robiniae TaxID=2778365 RepID=A0ABQ3UQH0_9CHLR|nr:hypothetical protein KSB_34060 [Ktedonobacter robiniae]